jgi:hypothetical protein
VQKTRIEDALGLLRPVKSSLGPAAPLAISTTTGQLRRLAMLENPDDYVSQPLKRATTISGAPPWFCTYSRPSTVLALCRPLNRRQLHGSKNSLAEPGPGWSCGYTDGSYGATARYPDSSRPARCRR